MLSTLTKEQLINLDAMAATAGLGADILMERAGMALASYLEERVGSDKTVLFLCGPGGNGGDGLVAARHLRHQGRKVSVVMASDTSSAVVKTNKNLVEQMDVPLLSWEEEFSFTPYDVLVDCLLGYGQDGAPRGTVKDMVVAAKGSGKDVYACDIPTGIHADTGEVFADHLSAKGTISFAAPKQGFRNEEARKTCGDIVVTGIGIPRFVYRLAVPKGEFLIEGGEAYP